MIGSPLILDVERNLFPLMIRDREWSSFDVFVSKRCPRIPWIIALNFLLSLPHQQRALFSSAVHHSMVIKWLDIVCTNYSRRDFREIKMAHLRKPPTEDVSHFIKICLTIFRFWTCMILCTFWWWHWNDVTDTNGLFYVGTWALS